MITGRRKEKLVAEITTGSDVTHTIIADVAQKFGGSDLGPDPHDFFRGVTGRVHDHHRADVCRAARLEARFN